MAEENRRLRDEVAEPRRINEILRAASSYLASELGPTRQQSWGSSTNTVTASRSRYSFCPDQERSRCWVTHRLG
ncbi:hypothetical protein OWR29_47410 [Actinoplanes sp. Pm04-4]|uniref:Transposase n=1 Tax=Paractinoplanes pyxinae TaxID=2997416 RepID=A0ABT4BJ93_9ACTN|nr:hypothetical protein [Actinoplanes pyxinae]MCY1145680.1 hypothetical protein [Actinoplanes pyxinae]